MVIIWKTMDICPRTFEADFVIRLFAANGNGIFWFPWSANDKRLSRISVSANVVKPQLDRSFSTLAKRQFLWFLRPGKHNSSFFVLTGICPSHCQFSSHILSHVAELGEHYQRQHCWRFLNYQQDDPLTKGRHRRSKQCALDCRLVRILHLREHNSFDAMQRWAKLYLLRYQVT